MKENPSRLFASGNLVCLMEPFAERRINGCLAIPAKIHVAFYNDEHDRIEVEEVPWGVARALAPDDVLTIGLELGRRRSARDRLTYENGP